MKKTVWFLIFFFCVSKNLTTIVSSFQHLWDISAAWLFVIQITILLLISLDHHVPSSLFTFKGREESTLCFASSLMLLIMSLRIMFLASPAYLILFLFFFTLFLYDFFYIVISMKLNFVSTTKSIYHEQLFGFIIYMFDPTS